MFRYLWTAIFSALLTLSASSFANVEATNTITTPVEASVIIEGSEVLTEIRASQSQHFESFQVANLNCGLKPLPPLGCRSSDAQCVCVQQGLGQKSCWWQWNC